MPSIDARCRRFSLVTVLSSLTLLRALQLVTSPAPIVINQPYSITFNRADGDPESYTLQLFATNTGEKSVNQLVTELDFKDGKTSITKDSVKDQLPLFVLNAHVLFHTIVSTH
jgi:hypothetical protein